MKLNLKAAAEHAVRFLDHVSEEEQFHDDPCSNHWILNDGYT